MKIHQLPVVLTLLACTACNQNSPPSVTGDASPAMPALAEIDLVPFKPALIKGKGEPLCETFLGAWDRLYQSDQAVSEDALDLQSAFPTATHFSFPDSGEYHGLYGESYSRVFDADGDGINQVLHVEGNSIGWRYTGISVFLFDNEASYADANTRYFVHDGKTGKPLLLNNAPQSDPMPARLAEFSPLNVARFMILGNAVYGVNIHSDSQAGDDANNSRTIGSLHLLQHNSSPGEICQVIIEPSVSSMDSFLSKSKFYQSLKPIYGNPDQGQACLGTMGWTAPPLPRGMEVALRRPRIMQAMLSKNGVNGDKSDQARELRFLSWGLADPVSWTAYLDWLNTRSEFIAQLASYYEKHFSVDHAAADTMALDAFRLVSDDLVYNHSNDSPLAQLAARIPAANPIDIRHPDPKMLVGDMLQQLLKDNVAELKNVDIAFAALDAALYTRQPLALVKALADNAAVASSGATANANKLQMKYLTGKYEKNLANSLLASLGNVESMQLLVSLGASVNAQTNEFKKTPLMYAAQLNDTEGAKILVASGADSNALTQGDELCKPLDRDSRTALMYAAENSSASMINLLMENGADKNARDSKGNDIAWYLARNTTLTAQQKNSFIKQHFQPQ